MRGVRQLEAYYNTGTTSAGNGLWGARSGVGIILAIRSLARLWIFQGTTLTLTLNAMAPDTPGGLAMEASLGYK